MNLFTYVVHGASYVHTLFLHVKPRILVDNAILKSNAGSSTTSTFVYQIARVTSQKPVIFTVTNTITSKLTNYYKQLTAVMRNGSIPSGVL
jgi:hypothetical protein